MLGTMPYANLRIALKESVRYEIEHSRQTRINSAFIAWQQIQWIPLKKGKRHDRFDVYCRKLGIRTEQTGLSSVIVDAEKDRANALLERAMGRKWAEVPQARTRPKL